MFILLSAWISSKGGLNAACLSCLSESVLPLSSFSYSTQTTVLSFQQGQFHQYDSPVPDLSNSIALLYLPVPPPPSLGQCVHPHPIYSLSLTPTEHIHTVPSPSALDLPISCCRLAYHFLIKGRLSNIHRKKYFFYFTCSWTIFDTLIQIFPFFNHQNPSILNKYLYIYIYLYITCISPSMPPHQALCSVKIDP